MNKTTTTKQEIINAFQFRYATKKIDPTKNISSVTANA